MKTNSKLYYTLVDTIKEYIPPGEFAAKWISQKLMIEKESAYRRLRGEVLFTFEEIAKLSRALGFSVDRVIDSQSRDHAIFDFPMINLSDTMKLYGERVKFYTKIYNEIKEQKGFIRMAANTLPFFFTMNYPILSRFRLYKWMYQVQRENHNYLFSNFDLPEETWQAQNDFIKSVNGLPQFTVILDSNVFRSMARYIEYFYKRRLITDQELHSLKEELLALIDTIERVAQVCHEESGIHLYLSSIDLESSYLHLESKGYEISLLKLYSIGDILSYNKEVAVLHKEWIESMKTFSVLISGSGEIARFNFIDAQKTIIKNIGK